jgi:hypothetical protein
MAAFDHGIKHITDKSARELARAAGVPCQRLTPVEGTLPATTERLADRAFRATRGRERFVVYFEFYTTWDRNARWDMLAKSGLLSQRLRLPTASLAFVLRRRGFQSSGGQFRLEAAGGPTQQLWFREMCFWRLEPEKWWEGVPGLMALYPLCRHGQQATDASRFATAAIERAGAQTPELDDELALLSIFGELAFPQMDVKGIIGRDKMKGSKLIGSFVAEALRGVIVEDLRVRFGEETAAEIAPLLERIEDAERLRTLHAVALRCADLDEFRAALRPTRGRR